MDEQFWKEAWTDRRIRFHMSEYNRFLEWFLTNNEILEDSTVLVPLCGKTLDMVLLRDKGLKVIGVEIAEQAVIEFFEENVIDFQIEQRDEFKFYRSNNITIICGDILKLTPDHTGEIKFIYDRAATVALPPKMRSLYYTKLKDLSDSQTELLLITGHSEVDDDIGPPFSVSKIEIEKAYKPHSLKFEILHEKKGKINSQRLRDKGITERVMVAHHIKFS